MILPIQTPTLKAYINLILLFCSVLFIVRTFAAEGTSTKSNEKAQSYPQQDVRLSCEVATEQSTKLDPLKSMLIQVGLYLSHGQYRDAQTAISKDKAYLIDGIVDKRTKYWLAKFCNQLSTEQQSDVLKSLMMSSSFETLSQNCKTLQHVTKDLNVLQKQLNSIHVILAAVNNCLTPQKTAAQSLNADYFRLSEDILTSLGTESSAAKTNAAEYHVTQFSSMLDMNFPTESVFYSYAKNAAKQNKVDDSTKPNVTLNQLAIAAKHNFVVDNLPNIEFSADCNCVEQMYFETSNYAIFSANQLLETKEKESKFNDDTSSELPPKEIEIDYSTISRIAFDGITINQDKIVANGWNEISTSFIYQAHRHYSEVDVMIKFTDWQLQTKEEIETQIEKMNQLFFASKPVNKLISFFNIDETLDGVVMKFDNLYPTSQRSSAKDQAEASATNINLYIKEVLEKNRNKKNKAQFSILLDLADCLSTEVCSEGYAVSFFKTLNICPFYVAEDKSEERCSNEKNEDSVNHILITMPEDFLNANQQLEVVLNSAYKEQTRGKIFLKVLPVIHPFLLSRDDNTQPLSDAIYFGKDMFGGNAYWPMPLESDENYKLIANVIPSTTSDPDNEPVAKNLVDLVPVNICKIVCTNRPLFRSIFVSYFAFLLIVSLSKHKNCVLCSFIESHQKVYFLLWMLVIAGFIAWLGCDEIWKNKQEEALLVTLGIVAIWISIKNYLSSDKYIP